MSKFKVGDEIIRIGSEEEFLAKLGECNNHGFLIYKAKIKEIITIFGIKAVRLENITLIRVKGGNIIYETTSAYNLVYTALKKFKLFSINIIYPDE